MSAGESIHRGENFGDRDAIELRKAEGGGKFLREGRGKREMKIPQHETF